MTALLLLLLVLSAFLAGRPTARSRWAALGLLPVVGAGFMLAPRADSRPTALPRTPCLVTQDAAMRTDRPDGPAPILPEGLWVFGRRGDLRRTEIELPGGAGGSVYASALECSDDPSADNRPFGVYRLCAQMAGIAGPPVEIGFAERGEWVPVESVDRRGDVVETTVQTDAGPLSVAAVGLYDAGCA